MIGIKVEVRGIEVKKKLAGLSREMQEKVLQPAINKSADKAKAEINRLIPQEFAVKSSEVRNSVDIRKARAGNLQAVIEIFGSAKKRGRSLNLIHFLAAVQAAGQAIKVRGGKGNKRELAALQAQLGFLIKKGGGLKKIEGAFIGNKGRTIFERDTGKQMISRPGKLTKHSQAIKPLQVIGFSQMFNSRRVSSRVIDKINKEMPVEIDRALKMLLARNS